MRTIAYLIFTSLMLVLTGCDNLSTNSTNISGEWLIPKDQIFDGGPGKDGIPALITPHFAAVSSTSYLNNDDLVLIIKVGDEVRIYPHSILDWHEIINDEISGTKFAITYCPLTGTGIAWNRVINGKETTFGVSGLLYNSNLIPYDRATNSNWSQMKLLSVNGSLLGFVVNTLPLIETSWLTAKQVFPSAKVVTTSTGYSRSYGTYPYGDYKTNHGLLLFPVSPDDSRLPRKERVLGVIVNNETRAYRFKENGLNIDLISDVVGEKSITVINSKSRNFIAAYQNELEDGSAVSLSPLQNELSIIMIDKNGNKYNLFGEVIDGPKQGMKLKQVTTMVAYWFAWGAFYPNTSIAN
ncbi:Hypothetical protein IALB_1942 [Ignavibacterium album JCM 16511]|uniref:DUF3179 domain-containing protein n=1 Tax=Ignavibacterium album (strain DSM 19864 / JCM 16511 / NBRC 101810 / Mat9-16) TaxID=945713 RepID=I0AKZ1_IGNAJ|nr:DUF3179 domain-containing protein [Ignavibacterium album]AFH49648.1 Hypothetical protein IALB_1942 [Ignavibacterium album JCM 16511]